MPTPPPTYAAAAFLAFHGVVHLLGTAVYLEFAEVADFPYKTTLLGGRWDLGTLGIRVFGVLLGGGDRGVRGVRGHARRGLG